MIHNLCVFFNSELKLSCLFHLYSFYFYHSQWCCSTTERHLLQLYFTRQLSASVTVQSPLTIVETFSSRILKYSLLHVHFPGSLSPRIFKLICCSDHQVYNLVMSCCIHWMWRHMSENVTPCPVKKSSVCEILGPELVYTKAEQKPVRTWHTIDSAG